ncbi:MAG: hypothetical protein Q4F21_09440 [Lachnospiraceae bacterium]|nr:hypothetical protein [Lachnospiraceae bacterium]
MIKTFRIAFRLKNAYKTNSVLYWLKQFPVIGKWLPDQLYGSRGLKRFAQVISVLMEIGSVFLGKLLYLLIMVFLASVYMKSPQAASFVHILFFLTIVGGIMNTSMFNPTRDKYYAMFLMGMDATEYTIMEYLYFQLKLLAGFLPFSLLFGRLADLSVLTCLSIPFFVSGVKLICTAIFLYKSRNEQNSKNGRVVNENKLTAATWISVALLLAAAYVPPLLGYALDETVFLILAFAAAAGGIFGLLYILHFKQYRRIYKELLTPEQFTANAMQSGQLLQESYQKKLVIDLNQTSRKEGYAYFNDLFMKRHSKMMTRSAKRITAALIAVIAAAAGCCMCVPEIKQHINEMMFIYLPYFLFIMYLINRGRNITQAMFMNCDHSMLTYRFYRQPGAILSLFTERLKSIVKINLMPALTIALGLDLLLLLSGGTSQPVHYLILFVSILAMSVFFSVHTLVLYYLLQPYNSEMEMKNPTYGIVNSITYFICYWAIGKKVPTLTFGAALSGFCILYVILALVLAYRLAPKTFRLR